MQAEVRPMRRAGRRLPREEVMAAQPKHGELVIFKRADPWHQRSVPVAALMGPDQVTYALPPLDQVRIARWRGSNLVLIGLEEKVGRKSSQYELQSWWVRLITPAAPQMDTPPASGA
jgi:hypothetical protein